MANQTVPGHLKTKPFISQGHHKLEAVQVVGLLACLVEGLTVLVEKCVIMSDLHHISETPKNKEMESSLSRA